MFLLFDPPYYRCLFKKTFSLKQYIKSPYRILTSYLDWDGLAIVVVIVVTGGKQSQASCYWTGLRVWQTKYLTQNKYFVQNFRIWFDWIVFFLSSHSATVFPLDNLSSSISILFTTEKNKKNGLWVLKVSTQPQSCISDDQPGKQNGHSNQCFCSSVIQECNKLWVTCSARLSTLLQWRL